MMRQLFNLSAFAALACGLILTMNLNAETEKPKDDEARLLRHVVLFKFKADATKEQLQEIVDEFGKLPEKIDAIEKYEAGLNNSPEGRSKGFTHCFLVTFKDEKGRDEYLPHAAHQEFVQKVIPILDDVLVVDYWTRE
ncbi:MAG: Dabb family protein [Planctomyces sp.]|nr:Dabb family protein [Planctomyces sp.]